MLARQLDALLGQGVDSATPYFVTVAQQPQRTACGLVDPSPEQQVVGAIAGDCNDLRGDVAKRRTHRDRHTARRRIQPAGERRRHGVPCGFALTSHDARGLDWT